jgi:hypothetical protein
MLIGVVASTEFPAVMQNGLSEEQCKLWDKIMTLYIFNGETCNKSAVLDNISF